MSREESSAFHSGISGFLEQTAADFRYAIRALTKSPAFFLLATIGSALGVAAITSVISVADASLIRGLPYRDPERLVVISDQLLKIQLPRFPATNANYVDYRAQNRVFEDIAAFEPRAMTVVLEDMAERVPGMLASSNFLSLLGGSMEQGRWIAPEENRPGNTGVVVVSHRFWRTHLGGANDASGRIVRIDEVPYTVIGVLNRTFTFRLSGKAPDLWIAANLEPDIARTAGALRLTGRLKKDVTLAQAGSQMQVIAADLKRRHKTGMGPSGEDAGYAIAVVPLREELYGAVRPTLYSLAAASGILLLLGLANMAILWLGRAAARRRESAVRLAFGASRGRVARQLVMEALIPSLCGGALALAVTLMALDLLNGARLSEFATIDRFGVDYRVFGFTMLLSAAAGIVSGALPLRSLFRSGAEGQLLIQDRAGISDRAEGRARPFLIATQIGLSCALLVPSLLLVRSLATLERVDPGFRTKNLMTANVTLPALRYRTPAEITGYSQRVQQELRAWAGANNVTLASRLPLGFTSGGDPFSIEGRSWGTSGTVPQFAHQIAVGADYFRITQTAVTAGRAFEARDFAEPAGRAIVNEALAKAFWPNESPLGKRILMGAPRPGARWMEILGVVKDVHTSSLSQAALPQIYQPFPQSPTRAISLIVSLPGDGATMDDLARVLRAADPTVPPYQLKTMGQLVSDSLERQRFRTQLFTAYGLLAFVLALFGVYSLSAYSAVRRRREFALRSAVGATRGRLFGKILSDTIRPAGIGIAVGLASAYAIARTMRAFLYGTDAFDTTVYVIAGVMALAVSALVSGLGGRHAIAVDPAEVLTGE